MAAQSGRHGDARHVGDDGQTSSGNLVKVMWRLNKGSVVALVLLSALAALSPFAGPIAISGIIRFLTPATDDPASGSSSLLTASARFVGKCVCVC